MLQNIKRFHIKKITQLCVTFYNHAREQMERFVPRQQHKSSRNSLETAGCGIFLHQLAAVCAFLHWGWMHMNSLHTKRRWSCTTLLWEVKWLTAIMGRILHVFLLHEVSGILAGGSLQVLHISLSEPSAPPSHICQYSIAQRCLIPHSLSVFITNQLFHNKGFSSKFV